MPGLWGLHAALATLHEFGPAEIEDHILSLGSLLLDLLTRIDGVQAITPRDRQERAGIITIKLPPRADPKDVFRKLLAQKVALSLREGMLRFSPHFYNTPEEIQTTVELLQELIHV